MLKNGIINSKLRRIILNIGKNENNGHIKGQKKDINNSSIIHKGHLAETLESALSDKHLNMIMQVLQFIIKNES